MTRTITPYLVVSAMAIASVIFVTTLVHATLYSREDTTVENVASVATSTHVAKAPSNYPAHLVIPVLGVDAHVQYVGLGKTGNMAVPTNYSDVGWYRGGTLPGNLGSAVIDGHVDNGLGLPGVFKNLSNLQIGDDLYIESNAGKRLHFVVEKKEVYPLGEVPRDLVFNQADTARLTLVTCEGVWEPGQKTYDHRLVVYATLTDTLP